MWKLTNQPISNLLYCPLKEFPISRVTSPGWLSSNLPPDWGKVVRICATIASSPDQPGDGKTKCIEMSAFRDSVKQFTPREICPCVQRGKVFGQSFKVEKGEQIRLILFYQVLLQTIWQHLVCFLVQSEAFSFGSSFQNLRFKRSLTSLWPSPALAWRRNGWDDQRPQLVLVYHIHLRHVRCTCVAFPDHGITWDMWLTGWSILHYCRICHILPFGQGTGTPAWKISGSMRKTTSVKAREFGLKQPCFQDWPCTIKVLQTKCQTVPKTASESKNCNMLAREHDIWFAALGPCQAPKRKSKLFHGQILAIVLISCNHVRTCPTQKGVRLHPAFGSGNVNCCPSPSKATRARRGASCTPGAGAKMLIERSGL